jgi:hypothetical protein
MVRDDLIDIRESYSPMWIRGLRCIACGNIVDPMINRNRLYQRAGAGRKMEAGVSAPLLSSQPKAA